VGLLVRAFLALAVELIATAAGFDREGAFCPSLQGWDRENGRGALFAAATGAIEVRGQAHGLEGRRDESFDYQGPQQRLAVVLGVPSAEKAVEADHPRPQPLGRPVPRPRRRAGVRDPRPGRGPDRLPSDLSRRPRQARDRFAGAPEPHRPPPAALRRHRAFR
jgi:hypothetical protein